MQKEIHFMLKNTRAKLSWYVRIWKMRFERINCVKHEKKESLKSVTSEENHTQVAAAVVQLCFHYRPMCDLAYICH